VQGQGYDVVLLGQVERPRIDVDRAGGPLAKSGVLPRLCGRCAQIGFDSARGRLLSTYGGRGPELGPWLKDAQINRDDNLRLQFLAGFGMNVDQRAEIYRDMLAFRHYPRRVVHWFARQSRRTARGNHGTRTVMVVTHETGLAL